MCDLTGEPCGSERRHTFPHQVAEHLTGVDVAPCRSEIERRMAEVAAGRCRRPVFGRGRDGASVPTRPARARGRRPGQGRHRAKRTWWRGPWRDATGLRWDRIDGERLVQGRSGHQGHNEEQRGEALTQLHAASRMPAEQGRLGVVCAGAAWSWQHVQALLPQAWQVLDYDHCAQDLQRGAQAHDGASGQALEGVEATCTRLSLGTVGAVLAGLKHRRPTSEKAAKVMANCWASLDTHRGRTHDRTWRRGGIESSNKVICHVRLKRAGAWWYAVHSHHR